MRIAHLPHTDAAVRAAIEQVAGRGAGGGAVERQRRDGAVARVHEEAQVPAGLRGEYDDQPQTDVRAPGTCIEPIVSPDENRVIRT